jgi:hypothetical protein
MNTDERRIILESDFERALDRVLGAFEREGFNVRPVNGDGRFRVVSDHRIVRCAELEVTLPELTFGGAGLEWPGDDSKPDPKETAGSSPTLLGCRISMYELSPRSTAVTAKSPLVRYPTLSSLMPRIRSRVDNVLRVLVDGVAQTAA